MHHVCMSLAANTAYVTGVYAFRPAHVTSVNIILWLKSDCTRGNPLTEIHSQALILFTTCGIISLYPALQAG